MSAQTTSLAEVRTHAQRLFLAGKPLHALRLWDAIVAAAPHAHDARTKVADCLAALGESEAAVRVYREVGWYTLKAGHPLATVVIAKVLESMGAEHDDLLASLVAYYGRDSELTAPLGARISPPPDDTEVAPPDLRAPAPESYLDEAAERAATCLGGWDQYPEPLHPIPLLSELSEAAFRRVLSTLIVGRLPGGATVIRQGEPGTSFFFIAGGEVAITAVSEGRTSELARLHAGSIFGEMSLLSSQPRNASATVVGEADLIEVSRDSLAALADELEHVAAALHRFTRDRLLSNLMAKNPLFHPFSRVQQRDLLRRFTSHDVGAGTDIIREGDPARGLFVVLSGEVEVFKVKAGGAELPLATLRAGDVFGEMSLIRGEPTTATVRASMPTVVLFLAREYVERIVAGVPAIREYLAGLTEDRELDTRLTLGADAGEEDVIIMI